MPRAKPWKSTHAAVRHLFRHLDDIVELRRNPLARPAFDRLAAHRMRSGDVLSLIRSEVLDAARACYLEDSEADRELAAARDRRIIQAVSARQPAQQTANELGLSISQFYRCRRAIGARVARRMFTRQMRDPQAHLEEPFRLHLRRAASLVDQGLSATAIAECENLVAFCDGGAARALGLLQLADAAIAIGDLRRAGNGLSGALQQIREDTGPPDDRQWPTRLSELVAFRLAKATGNGTESESRMRALLGLGRQATSAGCPDELEVAVAVEHCNFSIEKGRFAEASAAFRDAERLLRQARHPSPVSQVDVSTMAALTALYGSTVTPRDVLERFKESMALSLAVGSARGAVSAALGMMHSCAELNDLERACLWAQRAIEFARRMEGSEAFVIAAVGIANALQWAPCWPVLSPWIFEAYRKALSGSFNQAAIGCFTGKLLRRLGRPSEAVAALAKAEAAARRQNNQGLTIAVERETALALREARRNIDARERIHRLGSDCILLAPGADA